MKGISLIRLPMLLLSLFFLGKVVLGAMGVDYSIGVRVFAMVPLTVHLCIVWGALTRVYHGFGCWGAALVGVKIAAYAQILILVGTLLSYLLGMETHFNNPQAVVGSDEAVSFGTAMGFRAFGLVANSIIGAITASIGWAMGGFLPGPTASD